MRKNACGLDRAARLIVGFALTAIALGTSSGFSGRDDDVAPWQILAGYAGAELLLTGLLQWCPANYLLGIDTCASKRSRLTKVKEQVTGIEPGEPDRSDRVASKLGMG